MPFQSEKQRRYMHANLPDIAKRWERDYAGGGRIGFDLGSNGITVGSDKYNITFEPGASGSLSSLDLGHGYNVDEKNIAYGVDTTANIGPVEIGIDYEKFLDKYDVTKDDVTVEKDTNRDRRIAYHLGLNLEDLYAKIKSDRDFKNFYLTLRYEFKGGGTPAHEAGIYGLAEGGRTGFRNGWDPGAGAPQATETQSSTSGGDGGYQSVHQTGAITQTPGRPVYQDRIIEIQDRQRKQDLSDIITRGEQEKGNQEEYGFRQLQTKQKNLQKTIRDKIEGDWRRYVDPTTLDKVRNLVGVTSVSGIVKEIFKGIKRTGDMKNFMQDLNDLGLAGGVPGTNDPLYDQLWLHLEKKKDKYKYGDDDKGGDGVTEVASITYDDMEGFNEMERASGQWRQEQEKVDRSKQMAYYRMMMQPYMSAQGGRVPAGYNTGGLSNLFRLKNV